MSSLRLRGCNSWRCLVAKLKYNRGEQEAQTGKWPEGTDVPNREKRPRHHEQHDYNYRRAVLSPGPRSED
jgi:hypothetical protein